MTGASTSSACGSYSRPPAAYNRRTVPRSIGITDTGCVRFNNEDSHLVDGALGLYLVADGMGGAEAGEVASHLAVEAVAGFLASWPARDAAAMEEAFQAANRKVYDMASSEPRLRGMGTTLTGILENGDHLILASVGDSRAWLCTQGRLSLLTSDQTWVNEIGKALDLTPGDLLTHPMRHVLTMAIGVSPRARIATGVLPEPDPPSVLLLSSDGLHGVIGTGEMERILSAPITLEERGHSLIEAARQAGGPDNITAVLIEY
jgi:serine/threonine protein phosphatase PrpC